MKTITINTAASWLGTLRTFVDGEVFRESNIDIMNGDIADRLGYLKSAVDGKASLASANIWTDTQTVQPDRPSVDVGIKFYRELRMPTAEEDATEAARACVLWRAVTLPDADTTVVITGDEFRVPQITANRAYKFSAHGSATPGRRIRVVRPRSADAFSVMIRDVPGDTVAMIPASQQGWVEMIFDASSSPYWKVSAWGGGVTSIATVV